MTQNIVLLLIGAVIGFGGQIIWRRYEQAANRAESSTIAISKVLRDGGGYIELHNVGPDNVNELEVHVSWLMAGHLQRKQLDQFFTPDLIKPSHLEYIAADQRLQAAGLPAWSDDGIVVVTVEGLGVKSQKLLSQRTEVAVGLPPENR